MSKKGIAATAVSPTSDRAPSTLLELVQRQGAAHSHKIAYRHLADGTVTGSIDTLTYGELARRARALGAILLRHNARGERVLLLYPHGLDFIVAFVGSMFGGAVPVPVHPPSRSKNDRLLPRLRAIAHNSGARFALTTRAIAELARQALPEAPELQRLSWICTDELDSDQEHDWVEPRIEPDMLAFLQYTSGSTGTPKGVRVSHRNLIHNQQLMRAGFGQDESSRCVSWLPLFHDMGLIGTVLQSLSAGGTLTLLPPRSFLQRPFRWLEAISHFRANISAAPNFAYELCAQRVTDKERASLDLSCWAVAISGAEPVREQTIERFVNAFGACGFRRTTFLPCYGLAEATLFLTGGSSTAPAATCRVSSRELAQDRVELTAADNPDGKNLVSCGRTWLDQQVFIVDPRHRRVATSTQIGEIWVRGPSVAHGYWERPQDSAATFESHLENGEGPFLRTGDLGFLKDGELYVTGRLKDLILIRGRNLYPQDIESTVEGSDESLRPGFSCAFSLDVDDEERLVVVAEIDNGRVDHSRVIASMRRKIAEEHEVQVHAIALVRPFTIPKTSSGKIQRGQCRQSFLDGSLDTVAEDRGPSSRARLGGSAQSTPGGAAASARDPDSSTIETFIRSWLEERLQLGQGSIGRHEPFAQYGLDSVVAVEMVAALEQWSGHEVHPTWPWDFPTAEALARRLAETRQPSSKSPDVQPQRHGSLSRHDRGVAIVGMSCRFPGAEDPDAFWDLLRRGGDPIEEIPPARWDLAAIYDPDPHVPGKTYSRWGGLLREVDRFDARFFGIAPREARSLDPQQRLLLEVSWEAIERARISADSLVGSRTGVFIGISSNDYAQLARRGDPSDIDGHVGTGNAISVAAGRISYAFGLEGPCLAIDTACSSSLVAVHLACQSLERDECHLALAGGVNLLFSPETTVYLSRVRALSRDGRCKVFDAAADGYVRSEGCGVVVLKRLADAQADGDPILAVIRGSAINHDGRSNGLTAPNGRAQEAVIRQALANAELSPADVDFVETHGSGTPLGDPIEVHALAAALERRLPRSKRLLLGALKSQIGHLEAAAGIASVIKTTLALVNREIPPNLHYKTPNPHIAWDRLAVDVANVHTPWLRGSTMRVGGVSSFGFSGTNAHLVLEEAPDARPTLQNTRVAAQLVTLSAKSARGLEEVAARLREHVSAHPLLALGDIAFSLATTRSHHPYRAAIAASSRPSLLDALASLARGETPPGASRGHVRGNGAPKEQIAAGGGSLEQLCHQYVEGGHIDWTAAFPHGGSRVDLPTYPWQKESYWIQPDPHRRDR